MNDFFKNLGAQLKARFVTSWRTTLAGLLIDAAVVSFDVAANSRLTWLSAIGVTVGSLLKLYREQRAKQLPSTLATPLLVLCAALLAASAGAARAADDGALPVALTDSPVASQLGGCNASGKLCWGPEVSISLVAINLRTGKVEGSFAPGLGYGVTIWKGTNHELGLGGYAAFKFGPSDNEAMFSLIGSFNNYLRFGFSRVPIGLRQDNYFSLGFGSSL